MTNNPSRKIFINIAVRQLKHSMEFFAKLGFNFNLKFTDENAACMIVNEDCSVMLLNEPFFRTFTKREIWQYKQPYRKPIRHILRKPRRSGRTGEQSD